MASVFKPTFTRYVDPGGKRVSRDTPGARKVREKATKWYGQYTDVDDKLTKTPLSPDITLAPKKLIRTRRASKGSASEPSLARRVSMCKDAKLSRRGNKVVARQMFANLVREAERGKAGLTDPRAEQKQAPIESQVKDYEGHLRNKGVSDKHLAETLRRLRAVLVGCKTRTLADLRVEPVVRFLVNLGDEGAGARTRNTYRTSAKAFSKWCLRTQRLGENVLASLEPASGAIRRQRRALTYDELARLLQTAKERPVNEALIIRRGKRKGLLVAKVRAEVRAELERLGWERALMYKTLVLTALRRGELEALEVRHLSLNGKRPRLILPGSLTKNGEEASLPLMADLATDLKAWLAATGRKGPDRVFRMPLELVKIMRRDLKAAGIPYRDDRGRTLDVHALRHTTATILSRAKVSPRVAQEFMRHSDIKLTMQTYTGPRLLDEAEALAALPHLALNSEESASEAQESPRSRNVS